MSFKAEIRASLGWNWTAGATDQGRLDYAQSLLEGHGEGQGEAVWHSEQAALASGASITLDLSDLSRTVLGSVHRVAFSAVKAILVVGHDISAGKLVLGGAGANEWSEPFLSDGDQVAVPTQSALLLVHRTVGWTVDSANKNLKLTASGGDVLYSIAIVGTTTPAGPGA